MRGLLVVAAFLAVGVGYRGHDGLQGAGKSKTDDKFVDPFLAEDVAAPGDDEIPGIPDQELAPAPKKPSASRKTAKPEKAPAEPSKSLEPEDSSDPPLIMDLDDKPAAEPQQKSDTKAPAAGKLKSRDKRPKASDPFAELEPDAEAVPQRIPTLESARLTREIKRTAPPTLDDQDLPDFDGPDGKEQPKLRTLKNVPTLGKSALEKSAPGKLDAGKLDAGKSDPGKSDWKSFAVEAANSADSDKARGGGPAPESARFEQSGDIQYLNEPIEKIVIEGNKTIKTEEIKKLIKTREGRVADPKQIKEDVRTLVQKRWFFDVETRIAQSKDGPGKVLVFRVSERPMLKKITYIGNKKIKDKALNEAHMLKVNGGYDVGQNREAVHRILALYQEKGYQHATVELEKGDSSDDREVVFKINEGPKVVVNQITFSGNSYFSTAVLKTQIKTKKVILWFFGGKYDHNSVDEDVHLLKQYYHNLGFFDVQIHEKVSESSDKSKIHVEYVIEEGQRFKVRNIEFVGNRVLSEEKLRKDLKVKPNDAYAQRFVDVDKNKIVAQYGELGRINAVVNPLTRSFEQPGYVDLVYEINEDRPFRIGRIHVRINGEHPHTKESAVLTKL
ncbi:MAG TPA: POTRA domain-containing protein, partial [Planctomycetaceae bacterium]